MALYPKYLRLSVQGKSLHRLPLDSRRVSCSYLVLLNNHRLPLDSSCPNWSQRHQQRLRKYLPLTGYEPCALGHLISPQPSIHYFYSLKDHSPDSPLTISRYQPHWIALKTTKSPLIISCTRAQLASPGPLTLNQVFYLS